MATKRNLKQYINTVCHNLLAEGVAAYLYGPATQEENVNAVLSSIILMRNDFISRVSHPEPGMPPRKYFLKLKSDFEKECNDFVDQICNLH
ncbi:MAG: hypothetical protein ACOYJF_02960 [Prevotella sp.]|jgi:hypothetical protein